MSQPEDNSHLEQRLLREIATINQQIADLDEQKRVLEALLIKVRREDIASKSVSRRNSAGRILVETAIMDALRASKKPLDNHTLYQAVLRRDSSVKSSTFRSHLLRLSQRGEIISAFKRRGVWKLPLETSSSNEKPEPTS